MQRAKLSAGPCKGPQIANRTARNLKIAQNMKVKLVFNSEAHDCLKTK